MNVGSIEKLQYLKIGVQGENDALDVEIDMSSWVEYLEDRGYTLPCFHVLFKPYGADDTSIMVSEFDRDTNILTWTITLDATLTPGQGYTEIRALNHPDDGLLKKSRIIPTLVEQSVTDYIEGGVVPSPYQDWVNNLLEARDQLANILGGATTEYHNSDTPVIPDDDEWTETPYPTKGKYLWSRLRYDWGTGNYTYTYTLSYIGMDGEGSVEMINGMDGAVTLDANDISYDKTSPTSPTIKSVLDYKIDISKIVYSSTSPANPTTGTIWLKPKT